MRNLIRRMSVGLLGIGLLVGLTGCYGERVEVPPAHVGKILTPSGYSDGLKSPSTFRLPYKRFAAKDKLVLVETSDNQIKESMEVFMTDDQLMLKFDLRGNLSVTNDPERVDIVFEKLVATDKGNQTMLIDFDDVYLKYGQQVVRTRARAIVSQYSIEHVLSNLDAVGNEIFQEVKAELRTTPLDVIRLGLGDVRPPQVILTAKEKAKEREIAIQQAEADREVMLTEADAALQVARKQQEVDLLEAETQVLVSQKLSSQVTDAFVTQRMIRVMEAMANSDNKVFFISDAVMSDPAAMIGIKTQGMGEINAPSNNSDDEDNTNDNG